MNAMGNIRLAAVAITVALGVSALFADDVASKGAASKDAPAKGEQAKGAANVGGQATGGADKEKKADKGNPDKEKKTVKGNPDKVKAEGKTPEGAAEKQYKPLAEARARIGEIIADANMMEEVIKELSPEDQKTFVADVNAAIGKLPGSTEDRTAKYLNINREAYKGAAQGNMANLLAITFATVPTESLTVLSERYANDLFNRDSDPSQRYSDAAYEQTAREVVGKVEQATAGSDDSAVRDTLAILMFIKADNGHIEDLGDRLVETMPDATARELAKKEWIPAAMAEGESKSYDAMLAYADAGKAPNLDMVLTISGPQVLDCMLSEMTQNFVSSDVMALAVEEKGTGGEVAKTPVPGAPWNPTESRSSVDNSKEHLEVIREIAKKEQQGPTPTPTPTPEPEPGPKPYPYTDM